MLKKKETTAIAIIILILAICLSLFNSWGTFLIVLFSVFLVVIANILAKKAMSFYLDSKIEFRLWKIKRYGFKSNKEFKKPLPTGVFLPIIFSALSLGNLIWLASLVFDVKPQVYKAAKRQGLYSFSETTEYQIGLIAAAGVLVSIVFAVISYFAGWILLAKLNIWFAFFSMIPLSDLDGNKIFFGSLVMWSFLASIVLIGVAYIFLLV